METSDSEYFESADEDFQTDDEEQSSIKIVKKSTETETKEEVDKLVDDKKNANTTQPTINPKIEKIEPNANEKSFDNKKSRSITPEIVQKLADVTLEKQESPLLIKDNNRQEEKCENITGNSEPTIEKIEPNANLDNKKSRSATPEIDSIIKDEKFKEQNKQSKKHDLTPTDTKAEENLWEDDELDWGKEQEAEEEPSMWDNDDWEPIENTPPDVPQKPETPPKQQPNPQPEQNSNWSSWGNWGVSTILSTATQSVSTLTQGISTVLESGIGVPDPEELARINRAEKEKIKQLNLDKELDESDKNSGFGLGNLVSGVSHLTKLVETTSTKVISGGLDTLETIGKKTMEVLQEGDPGLKKKRAFLQIDQDKPVLSQLLREAKEKAESENKALEQQHFARKAKNYETLFDDHHGLVHLEALEMLSKQCDIKLETILESYQDEALIEMQETLEQVKELCELPDEDDDEQSNLSEIKEKLEEAVAEINIPITYRRLIETWEETEQWLNNLNLDICDEHELHQSSLDTLAQLTAIAVEQFHKAGELLLVKEHRSTADEADSLVQLTTTLTSLIGLVAAKFSDKLYAKSSKSKNKTEINGLITNVFFEAANSSSYIQDAFQLLVPVLQVGAV